jgi:hypothetical protein
MKNYILGTRTIAIIIISIIMLIGLVVFLDFEFKKEVQLYESAIGEMVVIKEDTLMVVDYSMFKDSYTLDNDIEISSVLFEKLKLNE